MTAPTLRAVRAAALAAAALLLAGAPVAAQGNPFGRSWFRITAGADRVSAGYDDWTSLEARTATVLSARDLFLGEVRWQRAFGDEGVYGAGGLRHAFGADWLATATVGGGSGRFALPELRADLALHRKLLASRRLLATAGLTLVRSKDVYRDRAALVSLTYYWPAAALEVGGRINWSHPGAEASARGLAALTLGRDGGRRFVLRGSAGRESYQLVTAGGALRSFASQEAGVEWQQWLGPNWSLVVGGEYYHSPYYERGGGRLGVARHW
ncbi:MAG: YaiO family outer membrane beta-barrel protein [Gemmatimonadales bacterium]